MLAYFRKLTSVRTDEGRGDEQAVTRRRTRPSSSSPLATLATLRIVRDGANGGSGSTSNPSCNTS